MLAVEWPEEGARKAVIGVGERDHHGSAAGPDVESARIHCKVTGGGGGDVKFLVAVLEKGLGVLEAIVFLESSANSAEGSVGSEDEVSFDAGGLASCGVFEYSYWWAGGGCEVN